jgi:hypothetical protein
MADPITVLSHGFMSWLVKQVLINARKTQLGLNSVIEQFCTFTVERRPKLESHMYLIMSCPEVTRTILLGSILTYEPLKDMKNIF